MLILGIDAAWTIKNASALALVEVNEENGAINLLQVGRSYDEFLQSSLLRKLNWNNSVNGSIPNFNAILRNIKNSTQQDVGMIIIDMPLSPSGITGLRVCDKLISKSYGSKGAATHTPSSTRPGSISSDIFNQLTTSGYTWIHDKNHLKTQNKVFFETYPHPVIIELMNLAYRLPYKVSNRRKYWKGNSPQKRWSNLDIELNRLYNSLGKAMNFNNLIPPINTLKRNIYRNRSNIYKGYEDILDALVCAHVGVKYYQKLTKAYGDIDGTIIV